jgi:FkbM family methyltransferase
MFFVDVGAQSGEYTLPVAKFLTQGQVWAFEPEPQHFRRLSHDVAKEHIKNVMLFPLAVSSNYRIDTIDVSYGVLGQSGPQVSTVILDDLLSSRPRVDVIKIDVEGHELDVLSGCTRIISRLKPVFIVEVHFQKYNVSLDKVNSFFRKRGYRGHEADPPGLVYQPS